MARSLGDITPIFVMGYGRSGTTLLRRVLNSYDDVFLWGEHHGFLQHVARGFYRVWDGTLVFDDLRPWQQRVVDPRHASFVSQSWLNSFDRQSWLDLHRGYLDSIFLPAGLNDKNFVGFKDTVYMFDDKDRTIDFLHQLFPQAIFVFIVRHGWNVLASWYEGHPRLRQMRDCERTCTRWANQARRFLALHESRELNSFWVCYEDLLRGDGGIRELLEEMGKQLGQDQFTVISADAGRSSSFHESSVTLGFNERWRTLPPGWRMLGAVRMRDSLTALGYAAPVSSRLQSFGGQVLSWMLRVRAAWGKARRRFRGVLPR